MQRRRTDGHEFDERSRGGLAVRLLVERELQRVERLRLQEERLRVQRLEHIDVPHPDLTFTKN